MASAHIETELKIEDLSDDIIRFIADPVTEEEEIVELKSAFKFFLESWKTLFNDDTIKNSPCYNLKKIKSLFEEIVSEIEEFQKKCLNPNPDKILKEVANGYSKFFQKVKTNLESINAFLESYESDGEDVWSKLESLNLFHKGMWIKSICFVKCTKPH